MTSLKHFSPGEFRCGCRLCGKGLPDMDPDFLRRLDAARFLAGVPFAITSAVRCPAHNQAVGGVPSSSHLKGLAVDLAAGDGRARFHILTALLSQGFTRIGLGADFIHVDADPDKTPEVIWTYS